MGCGDGGELWSLLSAHTRWEWVWSWQSLLAHTLGSATEMHSSWVLSLRWTGSGQEYAVVSRQELSDSAHSTPQLGARSGEDRSGKRSVTDAAQIPGSSTATLIPAATVLQL